MSSRFCVIRSGPIGNRPIADVMNGLVKRFGRKGINLHKPKYLESFTLLREGFVPLEELATARSVIASRPVGHEFADREPYIEAIRNQRPGRSRMNLKVNGAETEAGSPFEFALAYGWQMEMTGNNFPNCTFEIAGKSPGVNDLNYRRDLFMKIIDMIGLNGIIMVDWEGDDLRISASEGWQAIPILPHLGGANPLGICIKGFGSIDAALDAGERIIDRNIQRVDRCRFSAYVEGREGYETRICPLSAIDRGWMIEIEGSLSEAAGSVLAGIPSEDPPARVPAFSWEEKQDKAWYSPWSVYSGELVATDEGYCLELSTDRNDLDRLMDYASSIDGLSFCQMDQAGP